MSGAYYNEHEPYAAAWLRQLVAGGHIAPGVVDERDIQDVRADELRDFTQCHFFAGIGGWSLALRLAGWPDDRPVWTGSCPCQPFSSAGKRKGFADPRHLWPTWFRLIGECQPPALFGEQVASADGLAWFDTVSTDMEGAGYAIGAADICAAGVGAPHIRQRLFFVADAGHLAGPEGRCEAGGASGRAAREERHERLRADVGPGNRRSGVVADSERARKGRDAGAMAGAEPSAKVCESETRGAAVHAEYGGAIGAVADAASPRPAWRAHRGSPGGTPPAEARAGRVGRRSQPEREGAVGSVADSDGGQPGDGGLQRRREHRQLSQDGGPGLVVHTDGPGRSGRDPGPAQAGKRRPRAVEAGTASPWAEFVWIPCRDGKLRPTKPGLFPLANGIPGRVGRIRGAGNAICPQAAAEFIGAFLGG